MGLAGSLSHCTCMGLCMDFLQVALLHTTCCYGHWTGLPVLGRGGPHAQHEQACPAPALAATWAGTCSASAWGNSLARTCCRWAALMINLVANEVLLHACCGAVAGIVGWAGCRTLPATAH